MSKRKRLVAHVITGLNIGGAEMMLFKLLSRCTHGAFEMRVVSLIAGGALLARVQAIGVTAESLNLPRRAPSLTAFRRLRATIRRMNPDIIQGWMYHGNLAASAAGLLCGRRPLVVWNVRMSLSDSKGERLLTYLVVRVNALLSRGADAIIYNSRAAAHQHEAIGFDSSLTQVIPNGFDTDLFRPDENARSVVRRDLGVNDEAVVIGLIARHHPMKDHGMFLKAAALLVADGLDIHFLLAGTGVVPNNPQLKAMIAELGLDDHVSFLGERADTHRLNAALDIATSASAWGEGFANVIGEAMSCGVPCVVTDVGDSAWIVGDTGKVVPPRDAVAMAGALRTLVLLGKDGRRDLGFLARARVLENFSLGPIVQQYECLYNSLIGQSRV